MLGSSTMEVAWEDNVRVAMLRPTVPEGAVVIRWWQCNQGQWFSARCREVGRGEGGLVR